MTNIMISPTLYPVSAILKTPRSDAQTLQSVAIVLGADDLDEMLRSPDVGNEERHRLKDLENSIDYKKARNSARRWRTPRLQDVFPLQIPRSPEAWTDSVSPDAVPTWDFDEDDPPDEDEDQDEEGSDEDSELNDNDDNLATSLRQTADDHATVAATEQPVSLQLETILNAGVHTSPLIRHESNGASPLTALGDMPKGFSSPLMQRNVSAGEFSASPGPSHVDLGSDVSPLLSTSAIPSAALPSPVPPTPDLLVDDDHHSELASTPIAGEDMQETPVDVPPSSSSNDPPASSPLLGHDLAPPPSPTGARPPAPSDASVDAAESSSSSTSTTRPVDTAAAADTTPHSCEEEAQANAINEGPDLNKTLFSVSTSTKEAVTSTDSCEAIVASLIMGLEDNTFSHAVSGSLRSIFDFTVTLPNAKQLDKMMKKAAKALEGLHFDGSELVGDWIDLPKLLNHWEDFVPLPPAEPSIGEDAPAGNNLPGDPSVTDTEPSTENERDQNVVEDVAPADETTPREEPVALPTPSLPESDVREAAPAGQESVSEVLGPVDEQDRSEASTQTPVATEEIVAAKVTITIANHTIEADRLALSTPLPDSPIDTSPLPSDLLSKPLPEPPIEAIVTVPTPALDSGESAGQSATPTGGESSEGTSSGAEGTESVEGHTTPRPSGTPRPAFPHPSEDDDNAEPPVILVEPPTPAEASRSSSPIPVSEDAIQADTEFRSESATSVDSAQGSPELHSLTTMIGVPEPVTESSNAHPAPSENVAVVDPAIDVVMPESLPELQEAPPSTPAATSTLDVSPKSSLDDGQDETASDGSNDTPLRDGATDGVDTGVQALVEQQDGNHHLEVESPSSSDPPSADAHHDETASASQPQPPEDVEQPGSSDTHGVFDTVTHLLKAGVGATVEAIVSLSPLGIPDSGASAVPSVSELSFPRINSEAQGSVDNLASPTSIPLPLPDGDEAAALGIEPDTPVVESVPRPNDTDLQNQQTSIDEPEAALFDVDDTGLGFVPTSEREHTRVLPEDSVTSPGSPTIPIGLALPPVPSVTYDFDEIFKATFGNATPIDSGSDSNGSRASRRRSAPEISLSMISTLLAGHEEKSQSPPVVVELKHRRSRSRPSIARDDCPSGPLFGSSQSNWEKDFLADRRHRRSVGEPNLRSPSTISPTIPSQAAADTKHHVSMLSPISETPPPSAAGLSECGIIPDTSARKTEP